MTSPEPDVNHIVDMTSPSGIQEAEQMHADAIHALRESAAFALVTLEPNGEVRVRSSFNRRLSSREAAGFAHGVSQGAIKVLRSIQQCVEEGIAYEKQQRAQKPCPGCEERCGQCGDEEGVE